MTEDSSRIGPLRCEYEEEDDNDESSHDAREAGWESAACGKANTEPEVEVKGRCRGSCGSCGEVVGTKDKGIWLDFDKACATML